jgi:hypothetical protein
MQSRENQRYCQCRKNPDVTTTSSREPAGRTTVVIIRVRVFFRGSGIHATGVVFAQVNP